MLGFGSALHTIWEIVEFGLDELYDADLDVRAIATIRDFAARLIASLAAAATTYAWTWNRVDLGGRPLGRRREA